MDTQCEYSTEHFETFVNWPAAGHWLSLPIWFSIDLHHVLHSVTFAGSTLPGYPISRPAPACQTPKRTTHNTGLEAQVHAS